MKELSMEQKAKAYDEAIRKAKDMLSYKEIRQKDIEYLFPELKESEDERMRKMCIEYLDRWCQDCSFADDIKNVEKCIAWLEKQGEQNPYSGVSFKYNDHVWGMSATDGGVEILIDRKLKAFISMDKSFFYPISSQSAVEAAKEEKVDNQTCVKPTDKFEPKFKIGDWITDGCLHGKISEVLDDRYIVDTKFEKRSAITFKSEYNYRLWSIQDANDGDILAGSKDEVILIFRGIGNKEWNDVIDYYCCYECYRKEFIVQKDLNFWGHVDDTELKPATKKQRDLLFSKIKESGWEWDSKKKELMKGE